MGQRPNRRKSGDPWKLLNQVEEWVKAGIKVYSCYEAGACGYWYHRELVKRGAIITWWSPRPLAAANHLCGHGVAKDMCAWMRHAKSAS
jgi:hypothetical protein